MKQRYSITAIAALTALSLTTVVQGATIFSADFTSHGGTTASISSSTITAGIELGTGSISANPLLPFADGSANAFEVAGASANYAVVDQRPDSVTTSNYFTFDFTTGAATTITGATADVNRIRATGEIHLSDTMGNGSFDIYDGATLVGSLTTVYGTLGGGADKEVTYTGTAIALSASTTYTARFTSLAGGAPGTVGFSSFNVQAIPEPSSFVLLLGGVALVAVGIRRRR